MKHLVPGHGHAGEVDGVEIAARLRLAVGRMVRHLRRTQAGAALTSTETTVLGRAVEEGPVGLARLAAAEGMNPTMLSRVVRRLESEGLVAREVDPADRRVVLLNATAVGHRLNSEIRNERTDALNLLVGELTVGELETLSRALPILERLTRDLMARRT